MEGKKHYQGEKFTMDWDSGEKILSVTVSGHHKKEDAEEFIKEFMVFVEDLPRTPLKILVNGLDLSKSDHEARRIYTGYTKSYHEFRPGIVALCTKNLFIRMVGKFVVAVAPNSKIRIFDKTEEGLKWLKGLK